MYNIRRKISIIDIQVREQITKSSKSWGVNDILNSTSINRWLTRWPLLFQVSNFDFQMNHMYTGPMSLCMRRSQTRPSSTNSAYSTPCASPAKSMYDSHERSQSARKSHCSSPSKGERGDEDTADDDELDEAEKMLLNQRTHQWMGNILINRSRPSIPSNSKGTICPTAVETPIHILPCNFTFLSSTLASMHILLLSVYSCTSF